MKNFFKRANRGLILAAIVLVGFVAFVIADTLSFKKNKPQIESAVSAFTDALADCAVTSSSKEDFQKKAESFIADYWCSDNNSGNSNNYYGINISGYRNQLDNTANENYSDKNSGSISKWSANTYGFNITKSGPGYAQVQFECEIVAEFTGDPFLITPCEIMKISDFLYYENEHKSVNSLSQFSMTSDYVIKMKQVDGKWKVCQSESWGWSNPQLTVLDQSEGGDE